MLQYHTFNSHSHTLEIFRNPPSEPVGAWGFAGGVVSYTRPNTMKSTLLIFNISNQVHTPTSQVLSVVILNFHLFWLWSCS